jgi:hypothetical protein
VFDFFEQFFYFRSSPNFWTTFSTGKSCSNFDGRWVVLHFGQVFLVLPLLIDRQLINRQLIDRQLIDFHKKTINQPIIDWPTIDRPTDWSTYWLIESWLIDPYNWSTLTIDRQRSLFCSIQFKFLFNSNFCSIQIFVQFKFLFNSNFCSIQIFVHFAHNFVDNLNWIEQKFELNKILNWNKAILPNLTNQG